MEYFIVSFLTIAVVLFVQFPYILRSIQTTGDMFYLGTVHYPADYFYYVSQIMQGEHHWFSSTMMFTGEKLSPIFIGWQTVLTGKILYLLGVPFNYRYHVAVVLYLVLFLLVSYQIMKAFYPGSKFKRLLSFLIFVSSTAFVRYRVQNGVGEWTYWYYWYNTGNSQVRFSPAPHHMFGYLFAGISILTLYSFFIKNKRGFSTYFLLAFSGLVLGSINPVHWGLLAGGAFIASLVYFFTTHKGFAEYKLNIKKFVYYLSPALVILISGIPSALYAKYVFSIPPYVLSSNWEAQQTLVMDLPWLFKGSGVVIPLAIVGLLLYKHKRSFTYIFGIVIIAFCGLFYFGHQIPDFLHLTPARFWPSWLYIFWSLFAVDGLFKISSLFKKYAKITLILGISIYIILAIPTYRAQVIEVLPDQQWNGEYYLPKETIETFWKARDLSKPDDVFLIPWPYNLSFAAFTGRKVHSGFYLLTIDSAQKDQFMFDFIDGKLSEKDAYAGLKKYGIDYVMVYTPNERIPKLPFLKKRIDGYSLTVYEVINTNLL